MARDICFESKTKRKNNTVFFGILVLTKWYGLFMKKISKELYNGNGQIAPLNLISIYKIRLFFGIFVAQRSITIEQQLHL